MIFALVCIVLYGCVTQFNALEHIPWRDEVHAWNIAHYLGISDIFRLMKYEGHMFLWYVILKPFAVTNLFYPYSMLLINWVFMFLAVVILWHYSPFKPYTKMAITFMTPFFQFYPVVARCYSIGILLLFIIISMYKQRFKHPVIYSVLIFLAANTSLMALVGACAFGIMFLAELLIDSIKTKNYKKIILPLLIGISTCVILYIQVGNCVMPGYIEDVPSDKYFSISEFFAGYYKWNVLSYAAYFIYPAALVTLLFATFKECRKSLFFLIFTLGSLYYIFTFIYPCHDYNKYFILVYLIISYWMFLIETPDGAKWLKSVLVFYMSIFFTLFCFKNITDIQCFSPDRADNFVKILSIHPDIDNATLYSTSMYDVLKIAPYYPKTKFMLVDGRETFSLYSFENFYNNKADSTPYENFYNSVALQKEPILFFAMMNKKDFLKWRKNYNVRFVTIYSDYSSYFGIIDKNGKYEE